MISNPSGSLVPDLSARSAIRSLRWLYREASQLHERERLIEFVTTPLGKFAVWAISGLLILPRIEVVALFTPLLALVLVFPDRRNVLLSLGSVVAFYQMAMGLGVTNATPLALGFGLSLALSYGFYVAATNYPRLPRVIQNNPLLAAHLPVLSLIAVTFWVRARMGAVGELGTLLVFALNVLGFLSWRWTFLLFSGRRGKVAGTRFSDHLFYLFPAYGGTNVPYGKGHDYLSSRAARDDRAIAQAQLAGLKLLLLVHCWTIAKTALYALAYGSQGRILGLTGGHHLGLTPLTKQLASAAPGDITVLDAWASCYVAFVMGILSIAITGHLIVGCLRLFGFNVFRNTYKPLLAQSLLEFWNRYYYYFKELLLELFFYPTFLRTAGRPHVLRVFVSIMAAACLGNFYFHVMRDADIYLSRPVDEVLAMFAPRLVYSVALGLGVFFSMILEKKRRARRRQAASGLAGGLLAARRILGVWVFFCLLHVWNAGPDSITFEQRMQFFLALIGLGPSSTA